MEGAESRGQSADAEPHDARLDAARRHGHGPARAAGPHRSVHCAYFWAALSSLARKPTKLTGPPAEATDAWISV